MDRISALPKGILHDILGRLPDKDDAKTCVLSKSWKETWFSFPILSVRRENVIRFHDLPPNPEDPIWPRKVDMFTEYVTKRLMRLHDQHLTIKEVKLDLTYITICTQVDHHIDRWIQIAIESGVEVLELHLTGGPMRNWYNLPLKAKSLNKLVLSGEIRLDPAFINHSLKFFSMRTLSLSHILFGDKGVMEHFILHCPLIEHLTLHFCNVYNPLSVGDPPGSGIYQVNSLSLHGLQKLKGASVKGILEVYIGAPNLESLCYGAPADMDESFKLNLDSCTNLKCLSLWYLRSPDKWLLELLYKIPFLQSLMLHNCSLCERIDISGPQRISDQLEVSTYIEMNHRHLYRLREFFQNIKPQKVLTLLSPFIHELPPLFHKALQYFYEMLMGSNKCKCNGCLMHPQRWWHGLKVVKVTHLGRAYENVEDLEDLKALLNALAEPKSAAEEFITFALEL
ncbi:hypothetical protein PIB30_012208 [Stylosanthes scabra]|uniref:F-box domain-containing protein n=1 Tax=Stylosanthes scabra TaxID=79078 RepID=A0ABU6U8P6_9FABA|nr:hypothetical protein [Stylosanthes scabra]